MTPRITLCLPFINKLIKKKQNYNYKSFGHDQGIRNPDLSLMPIYKYLKEN